MRFTIIVPGFVVCLTAAVPAVRAQSDGPTPSASSDGSFRLTVDSLTSLAWYQVDPHTSLLWATTCPDDPHWRPGDSRHSGWDTRGMPTPKTGAARVSESVIPLYQRDVARPVCENAVSGEIVADDTVTWRGLHGTIKIDPTKLESGLDLRDRTAVRTIFQ